MVLFVLQRICGSESLYEFGFGAVDSEARMNNSVL